MDMAAEHLMQAITLQILKPRDTSLRRKIVTVRTNIHKTLSPARLISKLEFIK